MKKYILIILLFVNSQFVIAQQLSFEDLTNTFKLSYDELVVDLKTKGYEFFRKDVSTNGNETSYSFTLSNRLNGAPSTSLFFDIYKYGKPSVLYNYQLRYTTTSLEEFKQFKTLLISKKYKKSKDKTEVVYSNDDYLVRFEIIKITSTLNTYKISITNYTIDPKTHLDILTDQIFNQ